MANYIYKGLGLYKKRNDHEESAILSGRRHCLKWKLRLAYIGIGRASFVWDSKEADEVL